MTHTLLPSASGLATKLSSVLLVFLPHISATTYLIQVFTSLIEIASRSLNVLTSVSFPSLALTQTISQNSFLTQVCTFCAGSCLGSDSEGSFHSDSLPFPRLLSQDPQAWGSGASGSTNTPAWHSPTIMSQVFGKYLNPKYP